MREGLSPRQRDVLTFIAQRRKETGIAPSVREIGDALGGISTNGVNDHLVALERKGYVERRPETARSTTLTSKGVEALGLEVCPACRRPL
jgi:repressor LexA